MSNKTNRSNPGCAITALVLAILGFCLLKRAGGEFRNIPNTLGNGSGTVVDEPTPVPAIDPAEAARYRKEVEEVLADYSKDLKLASDKFERGLSEGSVGAHHDAMGAAHLGTARESRGNDLDPAAAEDVYRRDGLDVLEAVREHYKRFSRHSWPRCT